LPKRRKHNTCPYPGCGVRISPESKHCLKHAMRLLWQDSEYRAKRLAQMRSPQSRKRRLDTMKEKWQDPRYRQELLEKMHSEETRRKLSEASQARWDASGAERVSMAAIGATTGAVDGFTDYALFAQRRR